MSKSRKEKVYVGESSIPNIGKGLFSGTNIKKGSIIVEYKGKLKNPEEKISSSRSNIYFEDKKMLECPANDLASYANDAINFTGIRRHLMKTLQSAEPLYTKYPNAKINAEIKTNNNLHRAFLIACDDININEEIFCHYGFQYWFKTELATIGFLKEDEIEQNGFPEKIFEYPAFTSYIKEFYPNSIRIEVQPLNDFFEVIVYFDNDYHITMPMQNYANQIYTT